MSEPIPNLPLLRKILDHIDAHPDQHDQDFWQVESSTSSCGTTRCVAGWAIYFNGGDVAELMDRGDIVAVAGDLLGFTDEEADEMFYSDDNNVRPIAERIAARAGEVL